MRQNDLDMLIDNECCREIEDEQNVIHDKMRRRHTSQGCECHRLHEHYIQFGVHYLDDRFHCKVQTGRPPLTMLNFKNTCLIRDDEQEW